MLCRVFLKRYTLDHNMCSFRYSSLTISYKNTILVSCYQKNDGISFFYFFKQIYSGKVIGVVLMYRKHKSVSIFYEKLETLNAREEVGIILGDFNLNAQDPQVFQHISSVLVISNFYFIIVSIEMASTMIRRLWLNHFFKQILLKFFRS